MCHSSPTAQFLALVVTTFGSLFVGWHIWRFDRGRCLIFKRQDAFRWLIIWIMLISLSLFSIWSIILTYVKYSEYYISIQTSAGETEIVPVPFQLWSPFRQSLVRNSYHILSVAWALFLAVHSEETLYWSYLIRAIKGRNVRPWFSSIEFKIWVACCVIILGTLIGCAQIDTVNLTKMENNIFMVGAIFAVILVVSSFWLVAVFPSFIRETRRQGANPEVISRLQFIQGLNTIRTLFRSVYATALLTLAVDGYTEHQFLNTTPFWLDALYTLGFFAVFTSTAISLLILLPRSTSSESGIPQANVFVRRQPTYNPSPSYRSSKSSIRSGKGKSVNTSEDDFRTPWEVLGGRLNLDKDVIEELGETSHYQGSALHDLPFSAPPGSRRLEHPDVETGFASPPRAIDQFTSPVDVRVAQGPVDLNIVVTSTTVVVDG